MFHLFSKLSFKSSGICVAVVFHRRLFGDEVLACPVGFYKFGKPKLFGVKPGDCR